MPILRFRLGDCFRLDRLYGIRMHKGQTMGSMHADYGASVRNAFTIGRPRVIAPVQDPLAQAILARPGCDRVDSPLDWPHEASRSPPMRQRL